MQAKIVICILICAWGLSLRFQVFSQRDFSVDEIFQFQNSSGPFKPVWFRNYYGDFSCFPGDYLITYPFIRMLTYNEISSHDIENSYRPDSPYYQLLIRSFERHKWGLAIPHIFMTLLGFCFLFLLCRQYFRTIWGYAVAFLITALNTTLIYHAFEFRPYAVLPTLALGSFYVMGILIRKYSKLSVSQKSWISLFIFFTVIFHVFGIVFLCLSSVFILMLAWVEGRKWPLGPLAMKFLATVFVFAFVVWIWYASINLGLIKGQKIFFGTAPTFQFIPDPASDFFGFVKSVIGNLLGKKVFYVFLLGAVASFLIPRPDRLVQAAFFAIFIAGGIGLVLLAVLKSKYWFIQRQFIWVMPYFAFFIGWCWDSLAGYLLSRCRKK